jgi:hypothetical protein
MESSILGSEKILNNVECLLPSQPMAQAEGGQCLKYLAFKELRTTAGTCEQYLTFSLLNGQFTVARRERRVIASGLKKLH